MSTRDSGQAAVVVVIVAATMFAVLSSALLVVGGRVIERTRAQTAADAAALAGLDGGREAAVALAERHGATLVMFSHDPNSDQVTVSVQVGDAGATAAATDRP